MHVLEFLDYAFIRIYRIIVVAGLPDGSILGIEFLILR